MKKEYKQIDVIGDIHGHAMELETLLVLMGYQETDGVYRHSQGRRMVFLGDLIDRGPNIRRVLQIVKAMTDAGEAFAILGNHEVNALRFHTMGRDGNPLRPHTYQNVKQHQATMDQISDLKERAQWLNWFAGLPLSLEMGPLRFVHACWDPKAITMLNGYGRLEGETLEKFSRKGTLEETSISQIVNGPESILPANYSHETADGRVRAEFRVKWWMDLEGKNCRELIFPENPEIPELPPLTLPTVSRFSSEAPITFFGHYAIKNAAPAPILPKLACLDYGSGKGGMLCGYQWDGERALDKNKFVTTRNTSI